MDDQTQGGMYLLVNCTIITPNPLTSQNSQSKVKAQNNQYDETGKGYAKKLKNLNTCHLDMWGLNQVKVDSIKRDLVPTYDVIGLSETFLGQNSSELSIPGCYPIIRKDRQSFDEGVTIFEEKKVLYKRK